jgi:hypothetical protein
MSTDLVEIADQGKQGWLTPCVCRIQAACPLSGLGYQARTTLLPRL